MHFIHEKEEAWKRQLVTADSLSEEDAIAALNRYFIIHHDLPEPSQNPGRFELFSAITLAHPSKLFRNACCPDKDLFIVVSRVGNHDRVALWKMQGSKKWEVEIS